MTTRKIILTETAPPPAFTYSQGVQVDNILYISGQIGMTINGDIVDGIEAQTRQSLENIGCIVKAAGGSFKNLVRMTVLLADMEYFPIMNKIYSEYFQEHFPARAAYQVAHLPRDALIEIEAVAALNISSSS